MRLIDQARTQTDDIVYIWCLGHEQNSYIIVNNLWSNFECMIILENLQPVPSGMYKLLMWINKEYNNPPVIVTENGVSDNNGVDDRDRVNYFNSYLSAVLDAMVS